MASVLLLGLVGLGLAADVEPFEVQGAASSETWLVGTLEGQPLMTMRSREWVDGAKVRTSVDTRMAIRRTLGPIDVAIEVSESQTWVEHDGTLVSFRIEREEDGQRITAVGRIEDGAVVAEVHRMGRVTEQRLALDDGPPTGPHASAAGQAGLQSPGDTYAWTGVGLVGPALALLPQSIAVESVDEQGLRTLRSQHEGLPVTHRTVIDPEGELVRMRIEMGFLTIEVLPADGPVALGEATLSPAGLVTPVGPPPRGGVENRFRLPEEALSGLPTTGHQRVEDGVVIARAEATPEPLDDPAPYLAATPYLEIDDPEMRAWVNEVVGERPRDLALAERLTLAVRTHIVHKDLDKRDGTALEAFRERRGDCTEHANLLAAALRIAGIPSRIEIGFVWSAEHRAWIGHAWNAAWVDGAWHHLDSAYVGIPRSLYLATGVLGAEADGAGTMRALLGGTALMGGGTIETVR